MKFKYSELARLLRERLFITSDVYTQAYNPKKHLFSLGKIYEQIWSWKQENKQILPAELQYYLIYGYYSEAMSYLENKSY